MSQQPTSGEPSPSRRITHLGDFRLGPKLGAGAMGTIYRARQMSKERDVAVKILRQSLAKNPLFVQRFKREAQLMARLRHPNIVRCYGAGKQYKRYFLAMELVEGYSLYHWCRRLGKLSVPDAVRVAVELAEALRYAHENELIHRDVKPENVLIGGLGSVKLTDFGLAKGFVNDETAVTQTGRGAGTPVYIAPEQARNAKDADPRSDLYALGCSLYRILTGVVPFPGENSLEVVLNKMEGDFVPASERNRDVPGKLNAVISKLLSPHPDDRYRDASELLKALRGLNLASPRLSFLDAIDPQTLEDPMLATISHDSGYPSHTVSHSDTDDAAPALVWHVVHQDENGKWLSTTMNADQLRESMKKDLFLRTAKASIEPRGHKPLEECPELGSLLLQAHEERNDAARKSKPALAQYHTIKQKNLARSRRRVLQQWPLLVLLFVALFGMLGIGYWLFHLFRDTLN